MPAPCRAVNVCRKTSSGMADPQVSSPFRLQSIGEEKAKVKREVNRKAFVLGELRRAGVLDSGAQPAYKKDQTSSAYRRCRAA
jgi:hypothetical protein